MKPEEFMTELNDKIAQRIREYNYDIENLADNITQETRNIALGISVNNWGKVEIQDDSIVHDLLIEAKPELDQLKAKIRDRVRSRIHKLTDFRYKQRIDEMIEQAATKALNDEVEKAKYELQAYMKERVEEEMKEWKALIRMDKVIKSK